MNEPTDTNNPTKATVSAAASVSASSAVSASSTDLPRNVITTVPFRLPSRQNPNPNPGPRIRLLDTVGALKAAVGDGLNDDEITHLLLREGVPPEAGFWFTCFSEGCVTLSVPLQDLATWYPDQSWIAQDKEAMARAIAKQHGFSLCEPPSTAGYLTSGAPGSKVHHHIALFTPWETVVVAHPLYLKIRVFGRGSGERCVRVGQVALPLPPTLLQDLAPLYQAVSSSS